MKRKVLQILIFTFTIYTSLTLTKNVMASDSLSLNSKYFPLAVGNVYKYHYGSSGGFQYNYIVRVINETIINSKKYFILSGPFPGSIRNQVRYDSASSNIFGYSNTGYCKYNPFEELIDSIGSGIGDSVKLCTAMLGHYCSNSGFQTIFGIHTKTKAFIRSFNEYGESVAYAANFGIIHASYHDFWGTASESLIGCYINGVLYGDTILTEIQNFSSTIPSFFLSQNYPNPFNPKTIINYQLPASQGAPMFNFVSLMVYDALGKEVATLVNEKQNTGSYKVEFNGEDLPSGIYFYKLKAGELIETKRMILTK